MRHPRFEDTVSALAYSLAAPRCADGLPEFTAPFNDLAQFVLRRHGEMTDFLRMPVLAATLGFDLLGFPRAGGPFIPCPRNCGGRSSMPGKIAGGRLPGFDAIV